MKRTMNQAEEERTRLIELVKILEIKLNAVERQSAEENWIIKQERASLEAERNSFERERTFSRDKLANEEKRIEVSTCEVRSLNGET